MPLRQMSEAQATDLVIEHLLNLLNRTRSRKSRLKKQRLIKTGLWPFLAFRQTAVAPHLTVVTSSRP
jgi:hypothetical protein